MGNRGPAPGTGGRPRKARIDKITEGKTTKVIEMPDGVDIPEPRLYLSEDQRDGKPTFADDIYNETVTADAECPEIAELQCPRTAETVVHK